MSEHMKKTVPAYLVFFLLIHAQIGVSVVTLPYDVFITAKGDGWISVMLTGILFQCIIFIYIALMNRFPSYTWGQICEAVFGRFFGKIIVILYLLFFVFTASVTLAKYALLLSAWMMPRTPSAVLLLLMILIIFYIIRGEIKHIAQFFLLTSIVLFVYIGFNIYALQGANMTFILPIGESGPKNILEGILRVLPSYSGIEILLILSPYINAEKKQLLKVTFISNVLVTVFYTFITLTTLLFLSPSELKLVPEPVLYLIKSFSFKIIERPDLIFTSIWIVLVATTITMSIFAVNTLIHHLFTKSNVYTRTLPVLLLCFIIATPLRKTYTLQAVSKNSPYILIVFMILLPILIYLGAFIFSKKREDV